MLDPIHRNAVVVDIESVDAQSTPFPVRPNFEMLRLTMEGDVICQWDFLALHAFAHAAKSPSRFSRMSFWWTGGVTLRSLAIQSATPSGRKTSVSFARLRGDQDAAKYPARVIDRLGRALV